jgi:hypothetical protein
VENEPLKKVGLFTAVLLFATLVGSGTAFADFTPPVIVGHWLFYMKVYQGQEMPEPPQASLQMHFDFTAAGESTLSWRHTVDTDHCLRKAIYRIVGSVLEEEVVWLDPENTMDCSSDPDMQLGKKSRTPFYFRGNDLAIQFQINGEPLDMVWKRIPAKTNFGGI